jgi:hypothetical protein
MAQKRKKRINHLAGWKQGELLHAVGEIVN